jgi:hypothetical protein
MGTTQALRELTRAVHRGDLAEARRVLDYHQPDIDAVQEGMRQADRDLGRDPPLPAPPVSQTEELAMLRKQREAERRLRIEAERAAETAGKRPKKRRKAA